MLAPRRAASRTCCCGAGARRVYAVDVGYGQLHYKLRDDPRVVLMERTNIRFLESLPEQPDLAVADLSFISLRLALPAIFRLLKPEAPIIALVKPQFEAGRRDVGKGGVVRDPRVHQRVLSELQRVVQTISRGSLSIRSNRPSRARPATWNSSAAGCAGDNQRWVLQQLTIRNFATIDHLHVEWRPGLNVITGETGAGKSILIDAVGALLGDRLGPDVVRGGAERAMVEGVFVLGSALAPDLQAVVDEYGLEPEDGTLIVSRDIAGSGARGGARVNGRSVPLTILQELGEQLVDVHGQSQHMALLRPREQLEYLDRYAGVLARADPAGQPGASSCEPSARIGGSIVAEERETARLQDMLRHEVAEIERAELRDGEDDDLRARQSRLEHVEKLRTAASLAYQALSGDDADDQAGAIDLLSQAIAACSDGSSLRRRAQHRGRKPERRPDASRGVRARPARVRRQPRGRSRRARARDGAPVSHRRSETEVWRVDP